MKKYFHELDIVSDILDLVPHPQIQSIAHVICVCNDREVDSITICKSFNQEVEYNLRVLEFNYDADVALCEI